MTFSFHALLLLVAVVLMMSSLISASTFIDVNSLTMPVSDDDEQSCSGATAPPPSPSNNHHHHYLPNIISVSYCDGIRCAQNCRTQHLLAGHCYHDLSSGKHVMFHCGTPSNTSNTCFKGYGFKDSNCKRFDEISRNSLVCNSCSGSTVFDCSLGHALLEKTNCTNCANCSSANFYPLNACKATPQNGTWGQVSYLGQCSGSIVVKTTFSSWFGCFGWGSQKPFQIGYPTGFCSSSTTKSRTWGCTRPKPSNATTTTTTTPPALHHQDDKQETAAETEAETEPSVEQLLSQQKRDKRGNFQIHLPSDEDFSF